GSLITADKPVGVLSGHVRTSVTSDTNLSKDHVIEMLPPINTLGKRYMAVPFARRQGGDVLRVIAASNGNTNVKFTSVTGATASAYTTGFGDFLDFDLNFVTLIESDQPVLVVQYARSEDADPRNLYRPDRNVAGSIP